MAKTSIDIDMQQAAEAQEILGTTTLKSTVEAALKQVVREHARARFIDMGRRGAFQELTDPDFVRDMWS